LSKKVDSIHLNDWDSVITSKRGLFEFNLREIWNYKDLLLIIVKRDFTTFYKQTILGPLWFFLQPIISTVVFSIIFNKVAKIGTDNIPPYLFYLSGIIAWNYFSNCLIFTSNTFLSNSNLFSKVYFPRIIIPISIIISSLTKFGVQLLLFLGFYFYFIFFGDYSFKLTINILYLPLLLIQMAILGQGLGMIIASITTKYRDLSFLVSFGTQLLMYATPIIYPLSSVPNEYKNIIILNPMTSIIEGFRFSFFNQNELNFSLISFSVLFTIFIFIIGLLFFNKIEKTFIDTI